MNLDELIFPQDGVGEPSLTYWQPNSNPSPVTHLSQNYEHLSPLKLLNGTNHPQNSRAEYPLTDVIHSFIQDQQVKLSMGEFGGYEGQRRRMPSQLSLNPEGLLSAISASSQQENLMNDGLIHEEVTKAAKTLFSKRNRTLLHWLNPDVNKNQLKIDVDSAWDSLPSAEKVFYISQVLGKFAPQTTSLMVNPQIGSENLTLAVPTANSNCITSECKADSKKFPTGSHKCKRRKYTERRKKKEETSNNDNEISCDTRLVMGEGLAEAFQEKQKTKRKYSKKIKKQNDNASGEENTIISSATVDSSSKETDFQEVKKNVPNGLKVKRKYTKRKLIRKKYKKREPKTKDILKSLNISIFPEELPSNPSNHNPESHDMDVYIELDDDLFTNEESLQFLNEDVDSFWDNIGDPESLLEELDIS